MGERDMGTLLMFQPAQTVRASAPAMEMGKLLLFTGIRYERTDGTDQGEKKRGRRVKSRRRT